MMGDECHSHVVSQLLIGIGIYNIGDSAHKNVKILIIILALELCHFIWMEFEDIEVKIFGY